MHLRVRSFYAPGEKTYDIEFADLRGPDVAKHAFVVAASDGQEVLTSWTNSVNLAMRGSLSLIATSPDSR